MPSKTLAKNRKARFEYEIQNTMEVGIVLKGTEVKSIRAGQINITESFCRVDDHLQVYLLNLKLMETSFLNILEGISFAPSIPGSINEK